MKTAILALCCTSLFIGSCQSKKNDQESFERLECIYLEATESLKEFEQSKSSDKTMSILKKLKSKSLDDESVQMLLKLNYQSCPTNLQDRYVKALAMQSEMKDAVKRLAMSGALKSKDDAEIVNNFVGSVTLTEIDFDRRYNNEGAKDETAEQRNKRMHWWRDGKFGMFIHYGLFSGLAGEFNNEQYQGCVEWIQQRSGADFDSYVAEAMPKFNPKSGMPEKWVELAKVAGCKYTVLTSRHHEGYNMFETKYSPFNVKNTKGVDVVKEYAEACDKYDMKAGYYFSTIDWNHPDYDPTGSGVSYPQGNIDAAKMGKRQFGNHTKYKEYLLNIFNDLLSQHRVDLVWWDFSQPKFQGDYAWGATNLMNSLFKSNPNAIQNNRLYHSDNHLSEGGIKVTPTWKGDYSTAEHHVPATGIDGDWEACQTLNGTWGYSKMNQNWRSSSELIHELIDVVSRGGNYLLNIGPKSDGSIPEESVEIFKEIGGWMNINGEAIYGTQANPFPQEFKWGRVTRKGKENLYLLIYNKPENGLVELPCKFKGTPKAKTMFGDLDININENSKQTGYVIDVSNLKFMPHATVVEIEGEWSI